MSVELNKEDVLAKLLDCKIEKREYTNGIFKGVYIADALIDKDGNEICQLDIPQAVILERILELEKRIIELESKLITTKEV